MIKYDYNHPAWQLQEKSKKERNNEDLYQEVKRMAPIELYLIL